MGWRAAGGFAVAGIATAVLVVGTIGTSGGRASAAFLESARSLSAQTDIAMADGTLSTTELDALRGDAERLLQSIVRNPEGLRSLSADDLGALAQVLNALEDRLRTNAAATHTLAPVQSAAGLATTALRSTAPSHPVLFGVQAGRAEQFVVATTGVRTIPVSDAGSVEIEVQSRALSLRSPSPASGWTVEVQRASGRELEVNFRQGSARRVGFNAELEEGVLRIRIEDTAASVTLPTPVASATSTSTPGARVEDREATQTTQTAVAGAPTTHAAGPAGSVTLTSSATVLTVASVAPASGWTFEIEVASGREVEVDFRRDGARVKFNAELEDGNVRVRVELESTGGSTATATATSSSGSSGSGSSGSGSSGSGSSGSGSTPSPSPTATSTSGSSGSGSSGSGSSGSGSSGSGSGGGGDD